jgi:hypothetical protein
VRLRFSCWVLFQFAPLSLFITLAKKGGFTNEAWEGAFIAGSLLAFVETLFLLWKGKPLNRLLLGANIYLIIGGVATALNLLWLLRLYSQLRASAIFIVIFGVGLITTVFTSRGFLGVPAISKHEVMRLSYILLGFTTICGIVSFWFREDVFLSGTLPVVTLIFIKWLLNKNHERNSGTSIPSGMYRLAKAKVWCAFAIADPPSDFFYF